MEEITGLTKTKETIGDIKGVVAYLTSQGWRFAASTIYRHFTEGKFRRNKENVFEVAAVNRYARRNLKRLNSLDGNIRKDETCPAEAKETISNIKGVCAYLAARGWYASQATLYRHVSERKLNQNPAGRFDILDVEKYARKYLKCLDLINATSLERAGFFQKVMESFYCDKAEKIINFLSGDMSKVEELKVFLTNETGEYFKLQYPQTQEGKNE